ncbi:MAG TPA: phosphotransferase family protein, partial [Sphingopyxis sp.]|nr:phosphotransferase family protein [Sphingopyxis sp.]
MTTFADLLSALMSRVAGSGELSELCRLSGGANMESFAFAWGGEAYVLRRAPSAAYMADRPFGHVDEAALV